MRIVFGLIVNDAIPPDVAPHIFTASGTCSGPGALPRLPDPPEPTALLELPQVTLISMAAASAGELQMVIAIFPWRGHLPGGVWPRALGGAPFATSDHERPGGSERPPQPGQAVVAADVEDWVSLAGQRSCPAAPRSQVRAFSSSFGRGIACNGSAG